MSAPCTRAVPLSQPLVLLALLLALLVQAAPDGSAESRNSAARRLKASGGQVGVKGVGIQRHVNQGWKDVDGVFRDYKPFLPDAPYIMYWRPQKVGSSTILSLLTSYAFRYNVLAKLRSSQNYMCRKIAKCALEHLDLEHQNATGYNQYAKLLEDYVNGGGVSRGAPGKPSGAMKKPMLEMERISELVGPYMISTNHEICHLDSDLVREQLPCAFSGVAVAKKRGHRYGESRFSILDGKTVMTKHTERKWRQDEIFSSALPSVPSTAVIKEIFVVRNPLSRAMSVYYFWGELFKLHHVMKSSRNVNPASVAAVAAEAVSPESKRRNRPAARKDRRQRLLLSTSDSATAADIQRRRLEIRFRLGQDAVETGFVTGPLFTYHGNESTVPPKEIAMAFANRLPYTAGMPGPSFTWSAFAQSAKEAQSVILSSSRIMTIVTERLDESLVVARHYLKWSLADVVVTKVRKALSKHPKYTAWPKEAIDTLSRKLNDTGEIALYDAANKKLDMRIKALAQQGVDVSAEVQLLQNVRARVSDLCLLPEYLERYREFLEKQGFPQHASENKLRDAEDVFTEQGHAFGYNRDILYSFDVCGNCEAHAILFDIQRHLRESGQDLPVAKAALLKELRKARDLNSRTEFRKCPP